MITLASEALLDQDGNPLADACSFSSQFKLRTETNLRFSFIAMTIILTAALYHARSLEWH